MPDFDFDKLTDRRGSLSCKWDVADGELPMWVADMDFETAPAVKRAIEERAAHGIFGYTDVQDEYFRAYSDFWYRRHGHRFDTEELIYANGTVAAISSSVRRLTHPGESVLILAPVYNIFYNSILNNGRVVLCSDLLLVEGEWEIDWADFEEKLARPTTTMLIFCNPHNPVGRIWRPEELARVAELAARHGVTVFSDEVHAEFVAECKEYTPFAAASPLAALISVSALSVSKSFNLAGLQSACLAVKNEALRRRIYRGLNNDEVGEPNAFAMQASVAALTECDGWLDALVSYVNENKRIATEFISCEIPDITVPRSDATYLLWVDVSRICHDGEYFAKELRRLTGLYISSGAQYGECARGYVRINLATQRSRVLDGLERLKRGAEIIAHAEQ